ncbi:MAG: alpha/beta hydrolase fold domain-containing protein, partial [Planctomycetaceae bacterium]
MHRTLLIFMLLTTVESVAQDDGNAQGKGKPRKPTVFDKWDRNGDGRLVKNELPAGAKPHFERADANSDGFISRQEDTAFRNRNQPQPRQRQRGTGLPDSIVSHVDIAYCNTEHPRQKLDLYLPKNWKSDRLLPIIVYIHGGGWRSGNKASGARRVLPYVASGKFAGVSIGYRLSSDATWPAQIHDCKAALRWLKGNAQKFHLNPDRIGIAGSSAGGHLVAMLGTTGAVESLEGSLGEHRNQDSRVACVVDEFGPTSFLTMDDFPGRMEHNSPTSPESLLIGGPIQEHQDKCRRAGPLMYVSQDDPPFLIIHGTQDPLVPFNQSVIFAEKLKAGGVPYILQEMTGGEHGG